MGLPHRQWRLVASVYTYVRLPGVSLIERNTKWIDAPVARHAASATRPWYWSSGRTARWRPGANDQRPDEPLPIVVDRHHPTDGLRPTGLCVALG